MSDRQRARQALERDLARHRATPTPTPRSGWVRAIRDALGMTVRDFAARMGTTSSSWVTELEQNEAAGKITLETLRRAAAALGCRVEYVLVPERPLEEMVLAQARRKARRILSDVQHTMALEDQAVSLDDRINELADEFAERRDLWSEP